MLLIPRIHAAPLQGAKWLETCHSALQAIHRAMVVQKAHTKDGAGKPMDLLQCPVYEAVYRAMKKGNRAKEGRCVSVLFNLLALH